MSLKIKAKLVPTHDLPRVKFYFCSQGKSCFHILVKTGTNTLWMWTGFQYPPKAKFHTHTHTLSNIGKRQLCVKAAC